MGFMSKLFSRSDATSPSLDDDLIVRSLPEVDGERSSSSESDHPRFQQSLWGEATAHDSKIPIYRSPSPLERLPDQRRMRSIIDHLDRTEPRIHSPIEKKVQITVGTSIRPKSKFNDAVAVFLKAADQLDARGELDFAALVAEGYRLFIRHGGLIYKKRSRLEEWKRNYPHLRVPFQVQLLSYDWFPEDYDGRIHAPSGAPFVNGVAIFNDRKIAYGLYNEHPTDAARYGRTAEVREVWANEVYHVFRSAVGVPRGETPLSSIITTAENMADLHAYASQRRKNAVASALIFEQDASTRESGGAGMLGEKDKKKSDSSRWIRRFNWKPGMAALLPPGIKMNSVQPAADASDHDKNMKTENMVICSVLGIPYHEAMGDWKEAPERAMRYAGAAVKREVLQDRALFEHLFLNSLWRDVINMALVAGVLTIPEGMDPEKIYDVTWSWPPVQSAALDRELNMVLAMVVGGVLPPSVLVEEYFGMDYEVMVRRYAHDAAVASVNGMKNFDPSWAAMTDIAKSILAQATDVEARERALVDTARTDSSDPGVD